LRYESTKPYDIQMHIVIFITKTDKLVIG